MKRLWERGPEPLDSLNSTAPWERRCRGFTGQLPWSLQEGMVGAQELGSQKKN